MLPYLDVQKAFDTVWHNGLFHKLFTYGVRDHSWRILRKWYESSACAVLWEGEQSQTFCIKQGVKQGAILSPLLCRLFVNDLLVTLEQSGLGVKISNVYCGAPMYADDLPLIASSPHELQAMIDIVSQYATKWRYLHPITRPYGYTLASHFPGCCMALNYGHSLKQKWKCYREHTERF